MKNIKRILVFAVVATMLITPLDALQVVGGVRTLGTRAWATPLEFTLVGCLLAWATKWIEPKPEAASRWTIASDAALFGAGYIMTLLDPLGAAQEVFVFLSGVVLIQIVRYWSQLKNVLPLFFLLAFAGPATEATLVHLGTFQYVNKVLFGVPYWLPLLWGSGAFLAQSLSGAASEELSSKKKDERC